jgi:hypothetical protein
MTGRSLGILPAMLARSSRSRLCLVASLLSACAACAGPPRPVQYETGGPLPAMTTDGLYRVRNTQIGAAYVRPGASFAGYDAVLIDPVTVSYKKGVSRGGQNSLFEMDDSALERVKGMFQKAFDGQLSRSRAFAVVSEPGPRVLRVSGHIVNLVVTAPPFRGGEVDLVLDAGELTLILDVRDSESHEPLARIADRRAIRPEGTSITGGYQSGPVNNWGALREIFNTWARFLREGLDDLHQLPALPMPDVPAAR